MLRYYLSNIPRRSTYGRFITSGGRKKSVPFFTYLGVQRGQAKFGTALRRRIRSTVMVYSWPFEIGTEIRVLVEFPCFLYDKVGFSRRIFLKLLLVPLCRRFICYLWDVDAVPSHTGLVEGALGVAAAIPRSYCCCCCCPCSCCCPQRHRTPVPRRAEAWRAWQQVIVACTNE